MQLAVERTMFWRFASSPCPLQDHNSPGKSRQDRSDPFCKVGVVDSQFCFSAWARLRLNACLCECGPCRRVIASHFSMQGQNATSEFES